MNPRLLAACLCVLMAVPAAAQQPVPDLEFDSATDFLKLPAGLHFGEVSGVAVNSKGNVFVFTRSATAGGPAAETSNWRVQKLTFPTSRARSSR